MIFSDKSSKEFKAGYHALSISVSFKNVNKMFWGKNKKVIFVKKYLFEAFYESFMI